MNKLPPLTPENERRKRELIREWSKHAKPNNIYWKKIIALQGGDNSDYTEADEGMAPYLENNE